MVRCGRRPKGLRGDWYDLRPIAVRVVATLAGLAVGLTTVFRLAQQVRYPPADWP